MKLSLSLLASSVSVFCATTASAVDTQKLLRGAIALASDSKYDFDSTDFAAAPIGNYDPFDAKNGPKASLSYSMSVPPEDDTTQVITIDVRQVSRTFTVFDPASSHNTNKKRPIIIAFHGLNADSEEMRRHTQFDRVAKDRGWLVVYPQGEIDKEFFDARYWNGQGCCKQDGADDICFTKNIIDYTVANFQVDEDSVFITGFSNGAFMGYKLLCELGNRDNGKPWINAVAVHSGLIGTWGSDFTSCTIPNNIPLLHFHGEDDKVVPIIGKPRLGFGLGPATNAEWKSLEDTISFVAQKMCGSRVI